MEHVKAQLTRDLCRISVHLERAYPRYIGIVLMSGMQTTGVAKNDLAMMLVDSSEAVKQDGPVAEEARRWARMLGYNFNWHPNEELAFATNGASKLLSAHEKLKALNMFRQP